MTATDHPVISPKKLIEVALPLDAINKAMQTEKNPFLKGHPKGIHLWWARRPLAAARAVIFGQLVHDPEDLWRTQNPGVEPKPQNKSAWTRERARLFKIIEDLVLWENTTNEVVLEAARAEIRRSWKITCELNKDHPQAAELFNPDKMPGLHDPFAGGGAIPLEAQRLGLEAYASDLNPVAVLINKAMIEIPPKFAGRPPVHPDTRKDKALFNKQWKGVEGLAEDVRRYGQWMRDEAEKRIGHLYPKVTVTKELAKDHPNLKDYVGQELDVIAWLWCRTVSSPNPAFSNLSVPLLNTFVLSNKKGKEAYLIPHTAGDRYSFTVATGPISEESKQGTKAGRGASFRCIMSGAPIDSDYIKREASHGRLGSVLLGAVVQGKRARFYLAPSALKGHDAVEAAPSWVPDLSFPDNSPTYNVRLYGLTRFADLFSNRQLATLSELTTLCSDVARMVEADVKVARGSGASIDNDEAEREYASAVATYLGAAASTMARYHSSLCFWNRTNENVVQMFGRQVFPMVWDFAEAHPLAGGLSFEAAVNWVVDGMGSLPNEGIGHAMQADARSQSISACRFVSTDPPYYDNILYAELADFFYVWLRKSMRSIWPELFATIATPKHEELVASQSRHGSKQKAEAFFLDGMRDAIGRIVDQCHPSYPFTIYYAYRQADTDVSGTTSTGWETFLEAVVQSGVSISGTWPMQTEKVDALKRSMNALASSVVLVCHRRRSGAGTISRRQFVRMLNEALPLALDAMTRESEGLHSPVAPVDLSQAIIGPGMAIFSRYEAVLEADGTPMSVKTALQLINRFLAEDDFDADTQFCLHWFEQHGWDAGKFGEADTLARAKGTSVDGVKHAGVVEAGGGSVRLLRWKEYPTSWDPRADSRLPVWEALHHMIRVYQTEGDSGAATVLAAVARMAEPARQLAYRLYTLCERKGWAEDARAYNAVVAGWGAIEQAAAKVAKPAERSLFEIEEVES